MGKKGKLFRSGYFTRVGLKRRSRYVSMRRAEPASCDLDCIFEIRVLCVHAEEMQGLGADPERYLDVLGRLTD